MSSLREDLQQRARDAGLAPNKQRGQHFLADRVVLNKIVIAADIQPTDRILEIGPGLGILTDELVHRAQRVDVVDIDEQAIAYLKTRYTKNYNIFFHHQDALQYSPYRESSTLYPQPYTLVSNLPYEITSPFLWRYCSEMKLEQRPKKMVLLIQREVADRILVRKPPFNPLALLLSWFGTAERVCNVSRHAFWPEPRVEGAVVALERRDHLQENRKVFLLIRAGFMNPRRQLVKNLIQAGFQKENIRYSLEMAHVRQDVRAEQLDINNWLLLAENIIV